MSDADDSTAEPLQELPAGMARGYAEYKPVDSASPAPPPTHVGGYAELIYWFRANGLTLPRSDDGLAAIDNLIDSVDDKESLATLARPIGMFYGDLLTHTIPGAHWEVEREGNPLVRVTRIDSVDVVGVAFRRLRVADPSLLQNYAHVMEMVRRGD